MVKITKKHLSVCIKGEIMPKLVDMKVPKKTKKEREKDSAIGYYGDYGQYPYGLKLRFEKDQIDKLSSLKTVKDGDMVNIAAIGKVTEVRVSNKDKDKNRISVEIQIQSIDIPDGKNFKDAFKEATKK
jgi:hypothetical protein